MKNPQNDKKPLSLTIIRKKLKKFPGWKYSETEKKIRKELKFPGFVEVVALIKELTPFCEKMDHHPDVHIYYNRAIFELQRFDVGGKVTERDFTIAKKIEQLYKAS